MKRRIALLALALLPTLALCEDPKKETKPEAPEKTEAAKNPKVKMKTSMGDIVIELNSGKAPITVENFLSYVKKKHYDGTVFHRVIDGFMIQGGGFDDKLVEKASGKGIKNEGQNGLKNDRGTIAMARTSDPNSATAQFFINVKDNPMLDYPNNGGYAVFGKVVEGMDVVDKIKAVETGTSNISMIHPVTGEKLNMPAGDVPVKTVTITSVTVAE